LRKKPLKRSTARTAQFAKRLRTGQTDAEKVLWNALRNRQFSNAKFKRQVPISPYIVDFYCHSAKLIVEVDGGQHAERIQQDHTRTQFLERHGATVLSFNNLEVLTNLEGVVWTVMEGLNDGRGRTLPPSCPFSPGRRDMSPPHPPTTYPSLLSTP